MAWNKIEVPAYWQHRGTGFRESAMGRVYNDWLVDNLGSEGTGWLRYNTHADSWEDALAAENHEYMISNVYDHVQIQSTLTMVGTLHMLKYGPNWKPTGVPKK